MGRPRLSFLSGICLRTAQLSGRRRPRAGSGVSRKRPVHARKTSTICGSTCVFSNIQRGIFRLSREVPLHRRCLGHARGHARVSGRADAARDRADHRRPDSGDVSSGHAQLPDDGRQQGRSRGDRGKGPPGCGFRRAARSRRAGQLLAARAAVIGGCLGTSNILAGQQFGIDIYGTQAHSWIMAHEG